MNRCSEAASYAWSEPVAHWRMKVSICPSSLASVRSRRISGCRHRSSSKPRSRVHRLPVCAALLRILLLASVGEAVGLVPVSMICPPKVNPIHDRGAEPRVGEGLCPAGERFVGADRDRGAFLPLGQHLEQQPRPPSP